MTRKYRQRGYRESENDDERSRPKEPPQQQRALTDEQRFQVRSMRHAMDREAREVLRCHNCGRSVADLGAVGGESSCPYCAAALHCCRNCRHFDTASRWQCRAQIASQVPDKIRANSCAQFEPRLVLDATGRRTGRSGATSGDPRSQFESLFKR